VDGNDVSVYIRGINLIYADDGDKTYYHFNAHGDVVALTNESGNKTKSYSYNAFGVEYNEATLDDNPFRYCGEYYDKETQTIYLRARYYNAEQGRFTQEDPIRDGYNWYAYCGGNSVNCIDPTGYAVASCFGDIPDLLGGNDVLAYGLCGGGGSTNSYGYASEPTIPEFIGEPLEDIAVSGISTGAFVMAGITATADGPFPIGDVIGGIIVGIALAVTGSAIGYGEVNGSSIDINLEFKEIDLTKIAKKYIFYQCLKAAKEMLKKIII
jgi:RHS repeat-associated protein